MNAAVRRDAVLSDVNVSFSCILRQLQPKMINMAVHRCKSVNWNSKLDHCEFKDLAPDDRLSGKIFIFAEIRRVRILQPVCAFTAKLCEHRAHWFHFQTCSLDNITLLGKSVMIEL